MSIFSRRLNCHFCGARSSYSKGQAIVEFKCSSCEARNFLDGKDNITDTPASIAAATSHQPSRNSFATSTQEVEDAARAHQRQQVFCNTCLNNQKIYHDTLSNYLPDEDDRRYAEFERALPQFMKDLESRYPQICTTCAPRAQLKINRADTYSMGENLARQHKRANPRRNRSPSPGPATHSRDDGQKQLMRGILKILGVVVWISMAIQVVWHAYAVLDILRGRRDPQANESIEFTLEPTLAECVVSARHLRFDSSCQTLLQTYVPRAITTSLVLIWYNRGLKAFYDPDVRYESVTGQKTHFALNAIMMFARTFAFVMLSIPDATSHWSWSHIAAAHSFSILFMLGVRWLSRSAIVAHKWRLDRKMMPRPEDQDVLGKIAGPATEEYTPQASSAMPFNIFSKKPKEPFPINNLAPQRPTYRSSGWGINDPPPTPPDSQSVSTDAMDIDEYPPSQQYSRMPGAPDTRTYNPYATSSGHQLRSRTNAAIQRSPQQPQGWEGMRTNLFDIEDNIQANRHREENMAKLSYQPVQQSPFRGRLPPAPVSMERRLRNPVSQVPSFQKPHVTQEKNFIEQMREGIDMSYKSFQRPRARQPSARSTRSQTRSMLDDDESDHSPAKSRTRGNLDLRPSDWHLESDIANQATGLEDLLGGARISDLPAFPPVLKTAEGDVSWSMVSTFGATVAVVFFAVVLVEVPSVKRWVCLSLVQLIDFLGIA